MHTFELSGLGTAPFSVIAPKQHAIEKGGIFWCEHCGTQIKNRHFIKSADGKVSVVGIDCLKKTGDQGLIDGQRRLQREAKQAEREAYRETERQSRDAIERAQNGGRTNAEMISELSAQVESLSSNWVMQMNTEETMIPLLAGFGFEKSMQLQAYTGTPYTAGQLSVLCEIIAKKKSGARKNSAKYNATLPHAKEVVTGLQERLIGHQQAMEAIKSKIIALRCG